MVDELIADCQEQLFVLLIVRLETFREKVRQASELGLPGHPGLLGQGIEFCFESGHCYLPISCSSSIFFPCFRISLRISIPSSTMNLVVSDAG